MSFCSRWKKKRIETWLEQEDNANHKKVEVSPRQHEHTQHAAHRPKQEANTPLIQTEKDLDQLDGESSSNHWILHTSPLWQNSRWTQDNVKGRRGNKLKNGGEEGKQVTPQQETTTAVLLRANLLVLFSQQQLLNLNFCFWHWIPANKWCFTPGESHQSTSLCRLSHKWINWV